MKRFAQRASAWGLVGGLALVATLAAAPTARAIPVAFSTTGVFTAPAGSNATANNNQILIAGTDTAAALAFENSSAAVDTPTDVDLGTFNLIVSGTSQLDVPTGTETPTFTLTINQTAPGTPTSNVLTANVTGRLNYSDDNGISLVFDQTSVEVGDMTYELTSLVNGTLLINPMDSVASVTLTARVLETSAIPEPGSMALIGIGLAGLAGYSWRRRRVA